jgi:hypothetical protein
MAAADLVSQQEIKNKDLRIKLKTELDDYFKKNLGSIDKDLEFNITGIDFAYLRDIPSLVEDNIAVYISDNNINESEKDAVKNELKQNFANFLNKYDKYLQIFETNSEFKIDNDFINFIYVYLLLSSYNTAVIESQKELGAFQVTSWWFFTQGDFIDIKNDLDLKYILKKYDEMTEIKEEPKPEPQPEPQPDEKQEISKQNPEPPQNLHDIKKLMELGAASNEEIDTYRKKIKNEG